MKKFIITTLLSFMAVNAFAMTEMMRLAAPCQPKERLMKFLNEHGEKPLFQMLSQRGSIGNVQVNSIIMFQNAETLSYTIVEEIDNSKYCIISSGVEATPYKNESDFSNNGTNL